MNQPESKYCLLGWNSLYQHSKDGIRNKYDVVALLFHHYLTKQGFECTGLNGPNAGASTTSSEPPKENDETRKMPEGWNTRENYSFLYARMGQEFIVESCKSEHCIIFNISTNADTGRRVQAILFDLNDVVQTEGEIEDMIPSYKRMIDNMHAKVSDVLQSEDVDEEENEVPNVRHFSRQLPVPGDAFPHAARSLVPDAFPGAFLDDSDADEDEEQEGIAEDLVPGEREHPRVRAFLGERAFLEGRAFPGERAFLGERAVPGANPRVPPGGAAGLRNENMLANLLFADIDDDVQVDYLRQRPVPRGGGPFGLLRDRQNPYLPGGRRIGEADLNPLADQPPNGGMLFDPFQRGPHDYPRMRFDPFGPPGTKDPFGHHFDRDNDS